MAGRPKIYDEEKALDKAIEVFWKKGYENASADDLLKAMGIGKGSFYLAYKGGKQELFEKSIKRVVNHHLIDFLELMKTSDDPVEAIRNYFFLMVDPASRIGQNGCYFGNAVLQVQDKSLKRLAAEQLELIKNAFVQALKRAKKSGYLKSETSPELLGFYLLNLWNGLNITKNIGKDQPRMRELINLSLKILG